MHTQDPWWNLDIPEITGGIDLADRKSDVCILNPRAEVIERSRVSTTPEAIAARFESMAPARIVLEVGTHSPWMSRQERSPHGRFAAAESGGTPDRPGVATSALDKLGRLIEAAQGHARAREPLQTTTLLGA